MRIGFSRENQRFRAEAAGWLAAQMSGPFKALRHIRDHVSLPTERRHWESALGEAGWGAIAWPTEFGGRGASLTEQVIFAEEYARAGAPVRLGHLGVELIGPTLLAFGTPEQKARFLPRIISGEDIWCQGYSEPNAGSDLANVRTRAWREGDCWLIEGQKIWTSLGQIADWCFLLVRTEPGSKGRDGLSFLLAPMRQTGVDVRPIRQMTGEAEFNEVFFDQAETAADNVLGAPGEGWKVAMALLGFERGVSTLGQQMGFKGEFDALVALANANGKSRDPLIRQRLAKAYAGLKIMRYNALAMLSENGSASGGEALTYKLYWSSWRQELGDLAMDVMGPSGEIADQSGHLAPLANMFMMSRSETIYAGSSEIQRNIIAERGLGLPREARGAA